MDMCYSASLQINNNNMVNARFWCQAFALTFCLTPAELSAGAILYSNFGLGNGFHDGYTSTSGFLGTTFTTIGGGNLAAVALPLFVNQLSPAQLTLGLYADSSGHPGALLESWTTTFLGTSNAIFLASSAPVSTLVSVNNPLLTTGTPYWFVVSPSEVGVNWVLNNQGVNGGSWCCASSITGLTDGFPNNPTPTIALTATTTPEPISAMMGGLGCFALIGLRLIRTPIRKSC